ncbi:transketolase family protein [Dethiosulfovibrio russensis]|nr:transketolase C-terminal domain-containing protein [Dethiosulfovibrio russensis]
METEIEMTDRIMVDLLDDVFVSLGSDDSDLVILDADVASNWLIRFSEFFPDRYINLGMAELDAVATAAGMASAGKHVWLFSTAARLLGRGYDALRTAIAIPGLNVKMIVSHGGVSAGEDGAVAQMLEDLALTRSLPGVSVEVPSDCVSAEAILRRIAVMSGPAYVRLTGEPTEDLYDDSTVKDAINVSIPLVEGTGVTICACGIMVHESLKAAAILKQQDISAEVIDCHSVAPLPERSILGSVHRTGCCVVAEEHSSRGGLGEAVASMLCRLYPVSIRFVSVDDRPGQSGSPKELLEYYGLTYQQIVGAAVEAWTMRRR